MRRLLIALGFALALGAMVAALAPAALMGTWLGAATDGALRLSAERGTLWRGSAGLSLVLADGRAVTLPSITWRLEPVSLLSGAVEGALLPGTGARGEAAVTGRFRLERQALRLGDLRLALPADVLAAIPRLAALRPQGWLVAEADSLRWAPPSSTGEGRIRWQEATLNLPPSPDAIALGQIDAVIVLTGERIDYTLASDGDTVELDARGQWRPGAIPTLAGEIRAMPSASAASREALARLGLIPTAAPTRFKWPPDREQAR
jgi:hypothetical protein